MVGEDQHEKPGQIYHGIRYGESLCPDAESNRSRQKNLIFPRSIRKAWKYKPVSTSQSQYNTWKSIEEKINKLERKPCWYIDKKYGNGKKPHMSNHMQWLWQEKSLYQSLQTRKDKKKIYNTWIEQWFRQGDCASIWHYPSKTAKINCVH